MNEIEQRDEEDELLPYAPIPTISCACGFTVAGYDEASNVQAHADHACLGDSGSDVTWHESVFSFFGAIVILGSLLVIGVLLEEILKAVLK